MEVLKIIVKALIGIIVLIFAITILFEDISSWINWIFALGLLYYFRGLVFPAIFMIFLVDLFSG